MEPLPFVAWRVGGGTSTEKLSLWGTGKGLTVVAVVVVVAERGESSVDEGDIFTRARADWRQADEGRAMGSSADHERRGRSERLP